MTTPTSQTSSATELKSLYEKFVVPTYARFDLTFTRGEGAHLFDTEGKRYLDMGGGIAVCCLGHSHPEVAEALARQAAELVHVSNLYYTEPQARLAEALVGLLAPGKMFFCNSGAESNEGLFKLARKFGHEEGRFEILTTLNSFHGRTLGAIAATGQDKVKKGFEPMMPGFRHVPYNDLEAMKNALPPATVAIMVEGIQGEGGINPASPDYLLGLRQLCDEKRLLLLWDGVQCGHFRTGAFQSYERLLEGVSGGEEFMPDAISMAKSLGGGFPMGAFWVREPYADVLSPGTHGTTYGGTPLGCTVALKILEIIERDHLADHATEMGEFIKTSLIKLQQRFPSCITDVRGLGLMLGIELAAEHPAWPGDGPTPSLHMVNQLHDAGMITIPAGPRVVRLLAPLNLKREEAEECLRILTDIFQQLDH
jgi:acetylornithine aminotransferase/acetylornithine/N-succinyldiaminopimelate aminotransferase